MKKILLFAAMFAVGLTSNAQSADFNDAYPNGWIVNRQLKLAKYDNPITNALDTGIVTSPIFETGTTSFHLLSSAPAIYGAISTNVNVTFDAFAFKSDTRDFSGKADENFRCNTTVKAYLVPGTYTSRNIPSRSNIIGESEFITLQPGSNSINFEINKDVFEAGKEYRVFIVGRNNDCNGREQSYVIDNVVIAEAIFNNDFNTGSLADLGLSVFNGLSLSEYNSTLRGCDDNRGIATPAINFNTTAGLVTTGANVLGNANTESIKVRFDFLPFNANANLSCANSQRSLTCSTSVRIYIVASDFVGTGDVPSAFIARSEQVSLTAGSNEITIPVPNGLVEGVDYKLYIVATTQNCEGVRAQRFIIDNLSVLNTIEEQNFDNVFPEGWDFNRELKVTQYSVAGACDELEVGLTTAPIDGNFSNLHLISSPAANYERNTIRINTSFNLFAYDAETRGYTCADLENFLKCNVTLRAYLVSGDYNSTSVPTASQIIGQSEPYQLTLTNRNVVAINVTGSINESNQYRIVVFGSNRGCGNDDPQVYVIDDIRIEPILGAILPVTFTSFNAQRNKSKVELTWETAMEENNRGFHVQRNIDGTWKNIGFVFSQATGGNSTSALSYSFNDVNSSRGITQYRLLQVDNDNKGRYSEVRSVRAENQLSKIMVYPNPSNTGNINVMFEDASSLRDVYVSDVAGRVVKQYRNVNSSSLTIENLVDGYYTIQITNRTNAATTVEKVIIKKR